MQGAEILLMLTYTSLSRLSRGDKLMETLAEGGEVNKVLRQGHHIHLAQAQGPLGGTIATLWPCC